MMYASKSSSQRCVLRFEMLPWINLYCLPAQSGCLKKKGTKKTTTNFSELKKYDIFLGLICWRDKGFALCLAVVKQVGTSHTFMSSEWMCGAAYWEEKSGKLSLHVMPLFPRPIQTEWEVWQKITHGDFKMWTSPLLPCKVMCNWSV